MGMELGRMPVLAETVATVSALSGEGLAGLAMRVAKRRLDFWLPIPALPGQIADYGCATL